MNSLQQVALVMDHPSLPPRPSLADSRFRHQAELSMRARTIYLVLLGVARLNGETERELDSPIRQAELHAIAELAVLSVDSAVLANAEARMARVLHENIQMRAAIVSDRHRVFSAHSGVDTALNELADSVAPGSTLGRAMVGGVLAAYLGSFALPVREGGGR